MQSKWNTDAHFANSSFHPLLLHTLSLVLPGKSFPAVFVSFRGEEIGGGCGTGGRALINMQIPYYKTVTSRPSPLLQLLVLPSSLSIPIQFKCSLRLD